MEQTIFTILTNKKARQPKVLKSSLNKGLTLGVPWLFLSYK